LLFHLETLWRFTCYDHKNVLLPKTAFALCTALSGPVLTTNPSASLLHILSRLPQTVLWIWLNLLVFTIANQRLPQAIMEDTMNKPLRPLASKRLTDEQARKLLIGAIAAVYIVGWIIGGLEESVLIITLDWVYNDLGGSDDYLIRNILNGAAIALFCSAASRLATGITLYTLLPQGYLWLTILGFIIASSIQVQDLQDIDGDHARGRRTLPLVYGQDFARWSVAAPVIFWSFFCPIFWQVNVYAFILPVVLGSYVSFGVLRFRTIEADKMSWTLWNLWMMSIYFLPLIKAMSKR
jgi:4-hydroxybenzoate polyprenyltransferase